MASRMTLPAFNRITNIYFRWASGCTLAGGVVGAAYNVNWWIDNETPMPRKEKKDALPYKCPVPEEWNSAVRSAINGAVMGVFMGGFVGFLTPVLVPTLVPGFILGGGYNIIHKKLIDKGNAFVAGTNGYPQSKASPPGAPSAPVSI